MTTTPTPAPPAASPERPDLTAGETKLDALIRLRTAGEVYSDHPNLSAIITDAIATIKELRAANLRHCGEERELKDARARIAELEAALQAQVSVSERLMRRLDFTEADVADCTAQARRALAPPAATTDARTEGGA